MEVKVAKMLKNNVKSSTDKNYALKKLDPKISKLVKALRLTEDEAKRNLTSLEDTINELDNCKNCPGIGKCPNMMKGYVYYPSKNESKVVFDYVPCKKLKQYESDIKNKESDTALLNARMKDIDVTDKKRVKLIKWLKSFFDNYDVTKVNKGLYLHGSFGGGKTFLLAALLNELKEKKNAIFEIVYFPELLRNLKDNFNLVDSKVSYLANVEILLIDDIGAEKVSEWGRDEVLATILQTRMNNHMTTFFTSNLTIEELEKHLGNSKDSLDIVKARRIIERIKQLTEDFELITVNHRN
ncbi:MAG: primosomal protein DnaI [Bacilli bacterium]|nr:primosomal protein DnaI [Bacilli bacterium]